MATAYEKLGPKAKLLYSSRATDDIIALANAITPSSFDPKFGFRGVDLLQKNFHLIFALVLNFHLILEPSQICIFHAVFLRVSYGTISILCRLQGQEMQGKVKTSKFYRKLKMSPELSMLNNSPSKPPTHVRRTIKEDFG